MQSSNQPAKITLPFSESGQKQPIPIDSQIGIEDGRASYTDGFPPLTRTPLAAGGKPPFGTDMNGILYAITVIQRWQSAGGLFKYDADFSTAIGGYPKGALLLKVDGSGYWQNTVENNTANPDSSGAGWVAFGESQLIMTGAVQAFGSANAPSGWLKCNGAAVSRTTYGALFAAIGTTFGAGNGTTTFNVPELRGEFIRGVADGRAVDTGRVLGSTQAQAIQAHTHTLTLPRDLVNGNEAPPFTDAVYGDEAQAGSDTRTTSSTGGAETRPRNVALLYCIKT